MSGIIRTGSASRGTLTSFAESHANPPGKHMTCIKYEFSPTKSVRVTVAVFHKPDNTPTSIAVSVDDSRGGQSQTSSELFQSPQIQSLSDAITSTPTIKELASIQHDFMRSAASYGLSQFKQKHAIGGAVAGV